MNASQNRDSGTVLPLGKAATTVGNNQRYRYIYIQLTQNKY